MMGAEDRVLLRDKLLTLSPLRPTLEGLLVLTTLPLRLEEEEVLRPANVVLRFGCCGCCCSALLT